MKKAFAFAGALLLVVVGYLSLAPTPIEPLSWRPPVNAGFEGAFKSNGALKARVIARELAGPEAVTVDARGRLYTGTLDGRVVRVEHDGSVTTLANTGGRPLGVKVLADGTVLCADADKGLLRIARNGKLETLVDRYAGKRLRFTNNLDVLPDGSIVFTDASTHFGIRDFQLDAIEHRPTGRLYHYDPTTKRTEPVAGYFNFANGVAAAPDGSFVLVNETWTYRVTKVFLVGAKRGDKQVVIDNLPGFPDNITYNRERDVYWIGLASPRDPALDALAAWPALRKAVGRLPRALQPAPKRHGMALCIKGDGKVCGFYDDPRPDSYSPVTGVAEHAGKLYLSSLSHAGLGVVPLRR